MNKDDKLPPVLSLPSDFEEKDFDDGDSSITDTDELASSSSAPSEEHQVNSTDIDSSDFEEFDDGDSSITDTDEPASSSSAPSEEHQVNSTDIDSKQGNYIFTVGEVSSGKSVLLHLIMHRLWKKPDVIFEPACIDDDPIQKKIINDWIIECDNGILPDRTAAGSLQEFNVTIGQDNKKKLTVNFIEMSGEDVISIVPNLTPDDNPPEVHQDLIRYLKLRKGQLNKRFIFISDTTNTGTEKCYSEDTLFYEFTRFLIKNIGLKKIVVLFVASKWDLSQKNYKTVGQYFKAKFPQTISILKAANCNATYTSFSAGSIRETEQDGQSIIRINRLDTGYTDFVIQWIYYTFTGNYLNNMKKIKKSVWDKTVDLFK
jgi:hypothetical protein